MARPGSSVWSRYGYLWVTGTLFAASLAGHWWLAWVAFAAEQAAQGQPAVASHFLAEVGRDTLENWQSEFLQLLWQIAGLTFLFAVRSPQSAENEARLEEKVDAILRRVDPNSGELIERLDRDYVR